MVSGDEEQLQKFGQVFRRFSEETYIGSSPLYASLSDGIAEDLDVLDIASSARGRPVPNLLFAAVHYLLLRGAVDTLSSFYASLTRDPRPNSDAYPHFRRILPGPRVHHPGPPINSSGSDQRGRPVRLPSPGLLAHHR